MYELDILFLHGHVCISARERESEKKKLVKKHWKKSKRKEWAMETVGMRIQRTVTVLLVFLLKIGHFRANETKRIAHSKDGSRYAHSYNIAGYH